MGEGWYEEEDGRGRRWGGVRKVDEGVPCWGINALLHRGCAMQLGGALQIWWILSGHFLGFIHLVSQLVGETFKHTRRGLRGERGMCLGSMQVLSARFPIQHDV